MLNLLLAILLLEGFITISVEILSIRQLLPFFGGSVIITSIIIGIFLMFLALGYWRGGTHKENYLIKMSNNFISSMIWIGVGMSYIFIWLFFRVTIIQLSLPYLVSLSLYLLLILAPIVYWLGQTVPLTTNLFNQEQRVSHISGRALFLSTVGSFLGALVTSLILFQYLGVAATVVTNCILLFLLILRLTPYTQLSWLWVIVLAFCLWGIQILNVRIEHALFNITNNYGNYHVSNTDINTRILEMNLSNSSMITNDQKGFPYIEYIKKFLFQDLQLNNKKILVIGAGGFSLTAAGQHNNHFTYVDIDPAVKDLAEKEFLKKKIQGDFVSYDARYYLNKTKEIYDVIISDAYNNRMSIPPSLLTTGYFQQISDHLAQSGIVILNIIASPLFQDAFSQRVQNTILKVFPFCAIVPITWEQASNILYICVKNPPDTQIYTDDKTTSTFDFFERKLY